ncbi:MAG: hypothetical protein ACU85V_16575, partial [Gammaproteobacteria bacterium]
ASAESLLEAELAVYAAVIEHGLDGSVPIVVIDATTTGDPAAIAEHDDASALVEELGAPPEALDDWRRRNAGVATIDHPLTLDVSYRMLDTETRERLFAGDRPAAGWERFFESYAGAPGLLRLSRAGFGDDLTHALVYVEFQCGYDCGSGRLVHVTAADGGWRVSDAAVVWMVE